MEKVRYSEDGKTLIKCPKDFKGTFVVPDGVTNIEFGAFCDCIGLTSIEIPASVTNIERGAFEGCAGLTSINVDTSSTCYTSIDGVLYNYTKDTLIQYPRGKSRTDYIIPDHVTSIGREAFKGCSYLISIEIPNSVTSIGFRAFNGCTSLTSITIPESVTIVESNAFLYCPSLPIIDGLYYADTYLVGVVDNTHSSYPIKEGTRWIGDDAFKDCSHLTTIEIPNSVKNIGSSAFLGCENLNYIEIPNSVTSIGTSAFEGCTSLTSINIPNSVTSIGYCAFKGCTGLTSIEISNSVTSIETQTFLDCLSLISVLLPNSLRSIERLVFQNCTSLTSIIIPNAVTRIEYNAFEYIPNIVYNGTATGSPWGARALNGYVDGNLVYADATKTTLCACFSSATGNISIPKSVTKIKVNTFRDCIGLTSITIPDSIQEIGTYAFYRTGLVELHIRHEHPEEINLEENSFKGIVLLATLYVPNGTEDAYRNHPIFGKFKNIVGEN